MSRESFEKTFTKNQVKTVGTYLLDLLQENGVDHIFGIPGDYILRFDKRIEEHSIEFINATRENTAGYMADAYARMRGLGAACVTYGVGINIVNAIAQCYVESSPVIFISGAPGLDEKKFHLHHLIHKSTFEGRDLTQYQLFKQITIDQAILNDPRTASQQIKRVLSACLYHKKPVYLELPRSIIDQPILESNLLEPYSPPKVSHEALAEAILETKALLSKAKRPVIWAGHEISRHNLQAYLLKMAETLNIPIFSSLLGKGSIDERHPLFSGVYQGHLSSDAVREDFDNADLVLILGVLPTDIDTGLFTANIKKSGSPLIAQENSLAIGHHNYPGVDLSSFVKKLAHEDFPKTYPNGSKKSFIQSQEFQPKNARLTIDRVLQALGKKLKDEHILIVDIGDAFFASKDLIVSEKGYLASAYFATMGFAVPGAIGSQIAEKEKRAVVLVGDGAFQMTGTELSTALRYDLDPIVIVLNNHGYGTERPILEGGYNDIQNWNYSKLTEVLGGGVGIKTTTELEFKEAIDTAFEKRGTLFLIEADLPKDDTSSALKKLGSLAKK